MDRTQFTSIPELDMVRRMPRLGKIGLGVKMKNPQGREYPREVEYFVLDAPGPDATQLQKAMYEKFRAVYGEKPKFLDIMFPSDDRTAFFPQAYKAYTKAGLQCIGNGQVANRIGAFFPEGADERDQADEWHEFTPCTCDLYENGDCKRMGNLMVILPLVSMGGVWQIDTSSFYSITQINNEIEMYLRMIGSIAWKARPVVGKDGKKRTETAFMLTREPQPIQYGGKTQTHFTMHVRLRGLSQMTFEEVMSLQTSKAAATVALPETTREVELIAGHQDQPTTVDGDEPLDVSDGEQYETEPQEPEQSRTEALAETVEPKKPAAKAKPKAETKPPVEKKAPETKPDEGPVGEEQADIGW